MKKEQYQLCCTYLKNKYFVSTIYRQSSITNHPEIWYYETIAWNWDSVTRERVKMLEMENSGITEETALNNHNLLCKKLLKL